MTTTTSTATHDPLLPSTSTTSTTKGVDFSGTLLEPGSPVSIGLIVGGVVVGVVIVLIVIVVVLRKKKQEKGKEKGDKDKKNNSYLVIPKVCACTSMCVRGIVCGGTVGRNSCSDGTNAIFLWASEYDATLSPSFAA